MQARIFRSIVMICPKRVPACVSAADVAPGKGSPTVGLGRADLPAAAIAEAARKSRVAKGSNTRAFR